MTSASNLADSVVLQVIQSAKMEAEVNGTVEPKVCVVNYLPFCNFALSTARGFCHQRISVAAALEHAWFYAPWTICDFALGYLQEQ